MSKLTDRIEALAEATGLQVYVGRHGHRDDWFAGCGSEEWEGSTPEAALESLIGVLQQKAQSAAAVAIAAAQQAQKINGQAKDRR